MKHMYKALIYIVVAIMVACMIFLLSTLVSCNTVKKTSITHTSTQDSTVITSIDTVHIIKYDTTLIVKENYQTKIVELYDTVLTQKDSIITVLKQRIIWSNGSKETEKKGISSDSTKGIVNIQADLNKKEVIKETKKESKRFTFGVILIVCGVFLLLIGYFIYKLLNTPML